jgi:hypothetical protein
LLTGAFCIKQFSVGSSVGSGLAVELAADVKHGNAVMMCDHAAASVINVLNSNYQHAVQLHDQQFY